MRRDWVFGFGALSTLAVLVGLDLLLTLVEDRSLAASYAFLRGLRPEAHGWIAWPARQGA